ncbi:MAG: hypothetical protein ABIR80_09125, partial [Opitutaceae bacterium]
MRRRRFLFLLGFSLAAVVTLIVALPWWWGVALHALGPRYGLKYGNYERVGYGRFAIRDVEFQRARVRVTIARVEMETPVLWGWRHWRGKSGEVTASTWLVDVQPGSSAAPAGAPAAKSSGWLPLREKLRTIAAQLDRWLPQVKVGTGKVRWPGGGVELESATWKNRTLTAQKLAFLQFTADVSVAVPERGDEMRVTARLPGTTDGADLNSRGAGVSGEVSWWDQRASIAARFGETGWLPVEGALNAGAWSVPAAKLKLGELYSAVRGRGRIEWRDEQFFADVGLAGEPIAEKKAPPLEATLRGHGDARAFTVDALHAVFPGVTADLSEAVTVERDGKFRQGAARFALEMDLAKQPWIAARGSVKGEGRLVSGIASAPAVDFRFEALDVAAAGFDGLSATGEGRFEWPQIRIANGTLTGAAGEQLQWRGGWDFRTKEVLAANVEGQIRRTTVARWLPAEPMFDAVALKAQASGLLAELKSSGEATARGVVFRGVKPMSVALNWNGRGFALENFSAEAAAGSTKLAVVGSADRESVRLDGIELKQQDAVRLRLTQPASIRWRPTLQIQDLHLAGEESSIDGNIAWGAVGRAAIAVRNLPSSVLSDLIVLPGPAWSVTSFAVVGTWDKGPAKFSAVLGASLALGEGRRATINLSTQGDQNGIKLEALNAAEGAASIVNATGSIPV